MQSTFVLLKVKELELDSCSGRNAYYIDMAGEDTECTQWTMRVTEAEDDLRSALRII